MSPPIQLGIAFTCLAFAGLSGFWLYTALKRGEINVGRTFRVPIRRDENPIQFRVWMGAYVLATAIFVGLGVALLFLSR